MNSSELKDRMAFAALAHRRYPRVELPMAVICLESDRRTAGLGALDQRHRAHKPFEGMVRNIKFFNLFSKEPGITYQMMMKRPAHYTFKLPPIQLEYIPLDFDRNATITRVFVPEVHKIIKLHVDPDDFALQSKRDLVAKRLRRARWELKQSVREAEIA